ncbi:MAG TPA: response regulator [Anaerolineales bacterium]|nr:response regulator [Anaerolineales bacterium]HRQ92546.1 response regulator [Anaerolineales bacterium]
MSVQRVLIVEDQPEAAQMLLDGLRGLGTVSAHSAPTAEAALRCLQDAPVDLLITDVLLPGISGLELMARFRKHNPATRVILLSSVQDAAIRSQVARSGADVFFFKPVELADVLDAVERQLGLVQSILPNELAVIKNAQDAGANTAPRLAELRMTLQAYSVLLVSSRGQIVARAGVLPNAAIESHLLPQLLTSRQAAQRMAATLGAAQPDDLLTVRGPNEHIYACSLADERCLVVVTRPLSAARAAALAQALQNTAAQLAQPVLAAAPLSETRRLEDTDPHLEELLERTDTRPSRVMAEDFWQAVELPSQPMHGALSYEQAAQIGLAPSAH